MTRPVRIAVEGCGHGTLHAIYASVQKSCEFNGWDGVDLVIIGGDFQASKEPNPPKQPLTANQSKAVRNASDLQAMAVPVKYREMGDFHEYYSGQRRAPYLTIFVGGNHEASNHLWELYYGGWVAPNIYYLGAANVLRLGPLRIAGLSGIWKGYDYQKPHYERLPYSQDDVKSIYHVREIDARKLCQLRSQVDIGVSHDWPRGVEWMGDHAQLFKYKAHLRADAEAGQLGSVAAMNVLKWLRPRHWFSAHLHARYAAVVHHAAPPAAPSAAPSTVPVRNDAEIDLDLDDSDEHDQEAPAETQVPAKPVVDDALRAQLPASFARPAAEPQTSITNRTTHFLALSKCLAGQHFLQLLEVGDAAADGPLQLEYDAEWLAITRAFADHVVIGDPAAAAEKDAGRAHYLPQIERAAAWVQEHIVAGGRLVVPDNFARTAPVHDAAASLHDAPPPREYTNPQTTAYCALLDIPNPFAASEEERDARLTAGPRPSAARPDRGGFHGRGRGGGGRRGRARR